MPGAVSPLMGYDRLLDVLRFLPCLCLHLSVEKFSAKPVSSYLTVSPFRPHSLFHVEKRCVYNHMSDSDECRSNRYTLMAIGEGTAALAPEADEREDRQNGTGTDMAGAASGVSAIKSVHFTQACTKPWLCSQVAVSGKPFGERAPGNGLTFGADNLSGQLYEFSIFPSSRQRP